jgi:DNA polymerase IV
LSVCRRSRCAGDDLRAPWSGCLSAAVTGLCARVAEDLTCKGCLGRTIGIKLRFDDIRIVTRDLTVPAPTADVTAIRRAATAP